jgi:hypothetical protein
LRLSLPPLPLVLGIANNRVDPLDRQGHLAVERHGARTLRGLRVRIASRFLALAAVVSLNHELGRPSRALVDYVA